MPIKFQCPGCLRSLSAPEEAGGRASKCPSCGESLTVPEPLRVAISTASAIPSAIEKPEIPDEIRDFLGGLEDAAERESQAPRDLPTPAEALEEPAPLRPSPFEYRMVQVPPNVEVLVGEHKGSEAAIYLKSIVVRFAVDGWEFYRVDTIGVVIRPGCLLALLGVPEQLKNYHVVTFRRAM